MNTKKLTSFVNDIDHCFSVEAYSYIVGPLGHKQINTARSGLRNRCNLFSKKRRKFVYSEYNWGLHFTVISFHVNVEKNYYQIWKYFAVVIVHIYIFSIFIQV